MEITNWGVNHTLGMMTALSALMGFIILLYRHMEPVLMPFPFSEEHESRKMYMPLRGLGYMFGRWMMYAMGIPAGSLIFNWVLFKIMVEAGGMNGLWLVAGLNADLGFMHPPSFILAGLAFLACVLAMITCDAMIIFYVYLVEAISEGLRLLVGITVRGVALFVAWRRLKRAAS